MRIRAAVRGALQSDGTATLATCVSVLQSAAPCKATGELRLRHAYPWRASFVWGGWEAWVCSVGLHATACFRRAVWALCRTLLTQCRRLAFGSIMSAALEFRGLLGRMYNNRANMRAINYQGVNFQFTW